MKTINLFFGSTLLIVIISVFGCKKEDNKPDNKGNQATNYLAPTLAKDTLIKIPKSMSDKSNGDYNLALGLGEIELVNALSTGLASSFFYDQNEMNGWQSSSNSDGSSSYTWKYLQYTVKLTYFHSDAESWWKYEEDSASYSMPLYYISDKGTSGETDWYYQSSFHTPGKTAFKNVWTKTGGTYNSTFNWYNTDDSNISTQYISASNADRSGTLTVYERNNSSGQLIKQWYYVWDKNGKGSYTNYKEDGTTVNLTGTF